MVEVAVLLMAYGTPNSEEEIAPYLTDIRHGRPPSPDAVEELKQRYRRIGGHSPLLEITNAQASALQEKLNANGLNAQVYVGMRHWHPYVKEAAKKIQSDGQKKLVALVLAPHYSQLSIDGYKQALAEATSGLSVQVDFVESWCENPIFHQAVAEKSRVALRKFPSSVSVDVVFTAHSLPERILEANDPYPSQLRASSQAVAELLGLKHWSLAYQSAGMTSEKWLGPDLMEALGSHRIGPNILIIPIGFVSDHLEILYDIDLKAQEFAKDHGLKLIRTESLNASPTLISALADVVRQRVASSEQPFTEDRENA